MAWNEAKQAPLLICPLADGHNAACERAVSLEQQEVFMPIENTLQLLNTFLLIMSFVLGCMIGSFLNVCIWRLPRNESVVHPRSKCPRCGNLISWYDNIPLVSWLALGAKCRHCGESISWQYPFVEALTGVLFCCVYGRFGMTVAAPIYMILMAGLILVTFVDLADWTIPNEVTFPGIPLGIGCAVIGLLYADSGLLVKNVFESMIGVVLGGGILYLLDAIVYLLAKKQGMGFGDVKLLAMLGAFLGWRGVLFILFFSSLLGSVVGVAMLLIQQKKGLPKKERPDDVPAGHYLPFGPFLALAGVFYVFFGQWFLSMYGALQHVPVTESVFPMQ